MNTKRANRGLWPLPVTLLGGALLAAAAGAAASMPPQLDFDAAAPDLRDRTGVTGALDAAKVRGRLADLSVAFVENRNSFDPAVAFWAPVAHGQVYVTRDRGLVYQFQLADAADAINRRRPNADDDGPRTHRQPRRIEAAPAAEPGLAAPRGAHPDKNGKLPRAPAVIRESRNGASVPAAPAAGTAAAAASTEAGANLREHAVGALASAQAPHGSAQTETRVSRFIGADQSKWDAQLASYAEVALGETWPGVNLSLRARSHSVEKVFTVRPGADAGAIRMQVDGARQPLRLDADGALAAATDAGDIHFSAPVAWQPATPTQPEAKVQVAYAVDDARYGFTLGDYDHSRPLLIDPLVRATYLGGSDFEEADTEVAFGPNNTIFVAGSTYSFDFPGTAGKAQPAKAAGSSEDMFVAQLSSDLSRIIAATYIGGTSTERAFALAVNGTSVYVAGFTYSADFPKLRGGAQSVSGGFDDAVIVRLPTTLASITQATLIGGNDSDRIRAMRIASSGDVYVAGDTYSTNFPKTAGGAQAAIGDQQADIDDCNNGVGSCNIGDTFIARFSADLKTLRQATYFGGSKQDFNRSALAISPVSGDIYAGGGTYSLDIPGTSGGAQPANGNPSGDPDTFSETADAFIGHFSADLKTRLQATYFGGSDFDGARDFVVSPTTGDVYLCGQTGSVDLPGSDGGAQAVPSAAPGDPFVARLNSTLTAVVQSTYLGGSGIARDIAFNPVNGDLYVAGETSAPDFAGTAGSALNLLNLDGYEHPTSDSFGNSYDSEDEFVSRLSADLKTLKQSTFFGGSANENAVSISLADLLVDPSSGDVLIFGVTPSTDLPGTATGAQPSSAGNQDAFLARFDATLAGADTIADPFSIAAVTQVSPNSVVTSAPVTVAGVAAPTAVSVRDGAYSINGGAYVTDGGKLNNGDRVTVQHTSSGASLDTVVSTLSIGGQRAAFASTTGDGSPTAFAFTAQRNVPVGTVVASNSITVAGINVPVGISVGGDASGSYSVNSGAFTMSPGSVKLGDKVVVQHRASYNGNTSVTSTLTVGDRSANFTSTTQNVDTTPNAFTFPTVTGAVVNTRVLSSVVTPAGYTAQARISVAGGSAQYRINGGAFTSPAGFISPGQSVQLRAISAGTSKTTTSSRLTIGTTVATFKTVTQ